MTDKKRKPTAFRIDQSKQGSKTKGKKREPTAIAPEQVEFETEDFVETELATRRDAKPVAGAIRWLSLLSACLFALVMMWAGLAATKLIEELFARSELLGWIGSGLLGLAGVALAAITLREIIGLLRLRSLERLQEHATIAVNSDDPVAAANTLNALRRIYRDREDTAWGLARLAEHDREVIDPADRVRLAERDVMGTLDAQAGALIARTARRVGLTTAITPAAALDLLLVAAQNLNMLRKLAAIYGGRPGTIGTMRLARMVITHLAVTGGLAVTENLLQHVLGRGLIGKLSTRFGEGAVNGIMTARIGLAAIDLCRPLPFLIHTRPSLQDFLKGIVGFGDDQQA